MTLFAFMCCLSAASGDVASVSGTVYGTGNAPVPDARVFIEMGPADPLVETRTGSDGRYRFRPVEPGLVGVFAYKEGYAFGGVSYTVRLGEQVEALDIRLLSPDTIRGKVTDEKGDAVAGARLSPVLVDEASKVGIPFNKLEPLGLPACITGNAGRFEMRALPAGGAAAIKVNHPLYAQRALERVPVGKQDVWVKLEEGVTVVGTVLSRQSEIPVANADIIIVTPRPPNDSRVVQTDNKGKFVVRMSPGIYFYRAISAGWRSAGWHKLTVTSPSSPVVLYVSGAARVRGKVADARTEAPVAGARLVVSSFGHASAVVETGPTGEFEADVVEGESVVRLEAAPGHYLPDEPAVRVRLAQGQTAELPVFWLAPIPPFKAKVVDEAGEGVPGVAISLVRPRQYRWRVTDENGEVEVDVASLPASERIVAMAEHPDKPLGALFYIGRESGGEAVAQLLPYATVSGEVTNARSRQIEGAVVAGFFQDEPAEQPLALWRTITADDGRFEWPGIVPGVPMMCVAFAGGQSGQSMPFVVQMGAGKDAAGKDAGRIIVEDGESAESRLGARLKWREQPVLHGEVRPGSAVVMYASQAEAPVLIDAAKHAGELVPATVALVVVVDGSYEGPAGEVTVLRGQRPGVASTYLVDAEDEVVFETFGLPPLHAVRELVP